MRPSRLALLTLFIVLSSGCDRSARWEIAYAFGVDPSDIVAVRAEYLQGGCELTGAAMYSWISRGDSVPPPRVLEAGTWGFRALGLNESCEVVASGCEIAELPTEETIITALQPNHPYRLCSPELCDHGRCDVASDGDADSDADGDVEVDADTTDSDTDTGAPCGPGPTGIDLVELVNAGCLAFDDPELPDLTLEGSRSIDTTACRQITYEQHPRCVYTNEDGLELCVVVTKNFTIETDGRLDSEGARPLVILASEVISIEGQLILDAIDQEPGPGGGRGGDPEEPGIGPGAGGGASEESRNGGGGGGLAGPGGGSCESANGGVTSGNCIEINLLAGSGGGGGVGGEAHGGGGGGALQLYSQDHIFISGWVTASGAGLRESSFESGGGGGSGGTIILEAPWVAVEGRVSAFGGHGGSIITAQGGEGAMAEELAGGDGECGELGSGGGGGGAGRIYLRSDEGPQLSGAILPPIDECLYRPWSCQL